MRMETPCTDFNDAVCVCDYNYFLDSVTGRCEPCTVCPMAQGVYSHCEYDRDTVCEECLDNTFSDRESSLDPCLPCTICDEDTETELAKCTPSSDSVCHSKSPGRENPLFPYNRISPGDLCREGNVKTRLYGVERSSPKVPPSPSGGRRRHRRLDSRRADAREPGSQRSTSKWREVEKLLRPKGQRHNGNE